MILTLLRELAKEKVLELNLNLLKCCNFSEFTGDMDLVDLSALENQFSWFNLERDSMSRLDHFLTSEDLIDNWGHKA